MRFWLSCFKGIPRIPVCARCLLSFFWAPLRKACLYILSPPKQVFIRSDKITPTLKLSLLEAERSQLAQPHLVWQKLWSLYHIHGPSLDSLQYAHILLVLGSPDWAQLSRCGLTSAEQRGRIASAWLSAHGDGPLLSLEKVILRKSTSFLGPLFSPGPLH